MRPGPLPDEIREKIAEVSHAMGDSYAALSRLIGRHDRYLDTYVREKRPYSLTLEERAKLARYFGLYPRELDAEHAPSNQAMLERDRREDRLRRAQRRHS
jgi:hypothetical protein